MSKMIQIRNVPETVHRTLKTRAAREGISLSDFIKRELARTAARPSLEEWLEQTKQAKPISASISAAQLIRGLRESR
jgi:plasmid stability protein